MALFKKKDLKVNVNHMSGLPFPKNCPCTLTINEEENCIVIKKFMSRDETTIKLSFDKIDAAKGFTEEEMKKQSKVGRAVAGAVLFGQVGAVLGAMTADEKKKTKLMYAIHYTSNDEENTLVFRDIGDINMMKFRRKVDELIAGDQDQEEISKEIEL